MTFGCMLWNPGPYLYLLHCQASVDTDSRRSGRLCLVTVRLGKKFRFPSAFIDIQGSSHYCCVGMGVPAPYQASADIFPGCERNRSTLSLFPTWPSMTLRSLALLPLSNGEKCCLFTRPPLISPWWGESGSGEGSLLLRRGRSVDIPGGLHLHCGGQGAQPPTKDESLGSLSGFLWHHTFGCVEASHCSLTGVEI